MYFAIHECISFNNPVIAEYPFSERAEESDMTYGLESINAPKLETP